VIYNNGKNDNSLMAFETLHLDVYQLIFEYLSQQDLLYLLLLNHTFYQQVMKYIDAKLLIIRNDKELMQCCKMNMIISIKLNTAVLNWNNGLYGACRSGHRKLITIMIKNGAKDWDAGLQGACQGGHRWIAELMIQKGAKDVGRGLYFACKSGYKMLAKYMIKKGAEFCWHCSRSIEKHYNYKIDGDSIDILMSFAIDTLDNVVFKQVRLNIAREIFGNDVKECHVIIIETYAIMLTGYSLIDEDITIEVKRFNKRTERFSSDEYMGEIESFADAFVSDCDDYNKIDANRDK